MANKYRYHNRLQQRPQTFTAIGTYTRTATSTVATGFTTRAEYSGTLTRVATGDTRFVATFIGTPILSPIVSTPTIIVSENTGTTEHGQNNIPNETEITCELPENSETPLIVEILAGKPPNETISREPTIIETESAEINESNQKQRIGGLFLPILFAVLSVVIILALAIIALKYKKRADTLQNELRKDALRSRMASMIRKDRRELSEAGQECRDFNDDSLYDESDLDGVGDFDDYEIYEDFEIGEEDGELNLHDDLEDETDFKNSKKKGDYG
jgi:hypothetical protein